MEFAFNVLGHPTSVFTKSQLTTGFVGIGK